MVDAGDSKSPGPCAHVGSIPTSGINDFKGLARIRLTPFFLMKTRLEPVTSKRARLWNEEMSAEKWERSVKDKQAYTFPEFRKI